MLIDKYNSYILDKLPAKIADEIKIIASDTDNFQDEEMNAIYSDNFNELDKIIKDKYPEAIKPKKKLITKVKPKIVKKAKPKIVKKTTPKPTLRVVKGTKDKPEPSPAPADPKKEDIDCEEAIKTIKKQEKHKKEVAEKRAEAPKKSDSTHAREYMVKMFSHFLNKTKWKSDRAKSEKLAKHIIAGISEDEPKLAAAATKELDELIEKHYSAPPKLEKGGVITESKKYPGQFTFGADDGEIPMYTTEELKLIDDGYNIEAEYKAERRNKEQVEEYLKEIPGGKLTHSDNEFGGSWRIWKKIEDQDDFSDEFEEGNPFDQSEATGLTEEEFKQISDLDKTYFEFNEVSGLWELNDSVNPTSLTDFSYQQLDEDRKPLFELNNKTLLWEMKIMEYGGEIDAETMALAREIMENKRIVQEIRSTPLADKIKYAKTLKVGDPIKYLDGWATVTKSKVSTNSWDNEKGEMKEIYDQRFGKKVPIEDHKIITVQDRDEDDYSYSKYIDLDKLYVPLTEKE